METAIVYQLCEVLPLESRLHEGTHQPTALKGPKTFHISTIFYTHASNLMSNRYRTLQGIG